MQHIVSLSSSRLTYSLLLLSFLSSTYYREEKAEREVQWMSEDRGGGSGRSGAEKPAAELATTAAAG